VRVNETEIADKPIIFWFKLQIPQDNSDKFAICHSSLRGNVDSPTAVSTTVVLLTMVCLLR